MKRDAVENNIGLYYSDWLWRHHYKTIKNNKSFHMVLTNRRGDV